MNCHLVRPLARRLCAAVIAAASATAWASPTYSDWGAVVRLEGGWAQNTMTLNHAAPLVNPDACPTINAGYATSPDDAGHNLFHTVLLAAFLNRKEVSVLIDGCVFTKPRIVAVSVR